MDKPTERPEISVIIAAYNHENFVARCIRSLMAQTLDSNRYEVIVVNDASTDGTQYVLEQFVSPVSARLRVIASSKNRGLPVSLNVGINAAKADVVIRVDSDDFVNEYFLEFFLVYMNMNPDCQAVASDYLIVDDSENVIRRVDCLAEPIACSIAFRKKALYDLGLYDEDFLCHEDADLRIRFEKKYEINHLSLPLYRYRKHENNLTSNSKLMKKYKDQLDAKHGSKNS